MTRRQAAILGTLLVSTIAAAGAQVNFRPGQYEITFEMDLGIPREGQKAVLDAAGLDKGKRLECMKDEVKNADDLAKLFAREADDTSCKIGDVKTAGNKMTFTMTCDDDGVKMTSTTEMTFGPDSFTSVSKAKDNGGRTSTIKSSGKRIGDCK